MIQAVTTLAAVVQSQASPNGIYSIKSGTGTGFPLSTADFLSMLHVHSPITYAI